VKVFNNTIYINHLFVIAFEVKFIFDNRLLLKQYIGNQYLTGEYEVYTFI